MFKTDDYKRLTDAVKPYLKANSKSRTIFPFKVDMEISDLQYTYYTTEEDFNFGYRADPSGVKSEAGYTPVTVDVPALFTDISYGVDDLARIQKGKLPLMARQKIVGENLGLAEDLITLGDHSASVYGVKTKPAVSGTGTYSTASTGTTSVTSFDNAFATLMDGLNQLFVTNNIPQGDPLLWIVTPDVYGKMLSLKNVNDQPAMPIFRAILKEYNPQSEIIATPYLGATPTISAKKMSYTAGTTNGLLMSYNPNYAEVITSTMAIRSRQDEIDGLILRYLERLYPIFYEKKALIYYAALVIT